MTTNENTTKTDWVGSDRHANQDGVSAVLSGQMWVVKPDKEMKAQNPCLWAQAGVVKAKDCTNYYDCATCKYDQGMVKAVAAGKRISWQNAMRRKPSMNRVCRHSLTNRIERRICAYDYICATCDFDQYFEEVYSHKTKTMPTSMESVKGFAVPENYYFHSGHAWAKVESGGHIRVGMDDFTFKILGQADVFELPLIGKELTVGEAGWGLKRKDNKADVLSPVSGVILEVNQAAARNPKTANDQPYGDGWLFTVRNPDLESTLKDLMLNAESMTWMNHEVSRLEQMIESVGGPLAADGGLIQPDVFGNMPELGWSALTEAFLKTT